MHSAVNRFQCRSRTIHDSIDDSGQKKTNTNNRQQQIETDIGIEISETACHR